jgi:hypothetical protein
MRLGSRRHSRARGLRKLHGLALVVWLAGCAAHAPLAGPAWYGQHAPATPQHWTASAGHDAVDLDFEVPTPQQAEALRQRGVTLPRLSPGAADPRTHRDFIDRRVTAVGFGLTAGGYLLYCEGLELPVLVPEAHVQLGLTSAEPLNSSLYPDRDTALEDLAAGASRAGPTRYAYYRGAAGALVVPTVFSPVTTPRIARTMLELRKDLSEQVQRELKVLLLNLTGTRVLQGLFSRLVRVSAEPAVRRLHRGKEVREDLAVVPCQPAPSSAARAPPPPVPAPGPLAPSPRLVQALTGNNPTPPAAPGARLPQDVAVSPKVPGGMALARPISSSQSQNAQLQVDIRYIRTQGATNIRVNQQQVMAHDTQRVGVNRPDLQFDYRGRRYHVEYDSPTSNRGPGHQSRITSNDPEAEVILLTVP